MRRFTTVVRLSAYYSDTASGWAGWPLAHSEFGSSVNPITTRGVDYAHHITASPPGFENPAASLYYDAGLGSKTKDIKDIHLPWKSEDVWRLQSG